MSPAKKQPKKAATTRKRRSGDTAASGEEISDGASARNAISFDAGRHGYPGGKAGSGVWQQLINLMPPHRVFVEPYIGGGAIMLRKRPALVNIAVDLNLELVKQWRAAAARYPDLCGGATQSFLAAYHNDGPEGLALAHDYSFEAIHSDAVQWLKRSRFVGDELIYLDPPYLLETRTSKRPIYKHNLGGDDYSEAQHRQLLAVLKSLPCYVMISGYSSDLYRRELKGWRLVQFAAMTRGGKREECVWLNFPKPARLHDYRFLGEGYRERERIRKRCRRWRQTLRRMSELERLAVLSYITETDQTSYAVRQPIAE